MLTPIQLKQARKEAGLTQAEAAKLIYCSREAWSKWEAGKNQMPKAYWEYFKIKVGAKHTSERIIR